MMLQHLSAVFAIRVGHPSRSSTAPAGDTRSRLHAKAGATHPFLCFAPLWNPHRTKGSVAKTTMRYEVRREV
jgi:hypothetical protein